MASIGPNSPSTITNDTAVGAQTWTTPENAASSNNSYALITRTTPGPATIFSTYLKALNFGFSIPSGATIDGVIVEIERKSNINSAGYGIKDEVLKLVKGGTVVGTDKAATATFWPTTEAIASYGSSSDLWGTTFTSSDINNSTFGIVLQIELTTPAKSPLTASVDHVKITVHYTGGYIAACSTLIAGD